MNKTISLSRPLTMDQVNENVAAIDAERLRLGWSVPEASDFLHQHFNKRSRWLLTDAELLQALELFKEA